MTAVLSHNASTTAIRVLPMRTMPMKVGGGGGGGNGTYPPSSYPNKGYHHDRDINPTRPPSPRSGSDRVVLGPRVGGGG
eukprot:scaffold16271_cov35-Attheya_sp.AAC.1